MSWYKYGALSCAAFFMLNFVGLLWLLLFDVVHYSNGLLLLFGFFAIMFTLSFGFHISRQQYTHIFNEVSRLAKEKKISTSQMLEIITADIMQYHQ